MIALQATGAGLVKENAILGSLAQAVSRSVTVLMEVSVKDLMEPACVDQGTLVIVAQRLAQVDILVKAA